MKNDCYKKTFVLGIIVLFIGMSITPSTGNIMFFDDTTPPVTTISFDPPEPDGENGWYKGIPGIYFKATDDLSGVNHTYYSIEGGGWQEYFGGPIIFIGEDGEYTIEYFSIDKAGNWEEVKSATFKFDTNPPVIGLTYEVVGGGPLHGWEILFTATAYDYCSGMDRVEFYLNDELQDIVTGPGPTYEWMFLYLPTNRVRINGLILNPEITEENVNFYAIIVIVTAIGDLYIEPCAYAYDNAGNWDYDCISQPCPQVTISPGFYLFQNLTLPNDYTGYIGRFFISAIFNDS